MTEQQESPQPEKFMADRKEIAAIVYNDFKTMQRATFDVASQWGRWLLASLLLIHGGALFGLFTFLSALANQPTALMQYKWTVFWFVAGIICTLLSGFSAWINWSMHADDYNNRANIHMLYDPNAWLGESQHAKGIRRSYWASIVFGWLSAACIVGGAYSTLNGDWIPKIVRTAIAMA